MDLLTELLKENNIKTVNYGTNDLISTLKEINRSLQQVSDNLRDIKYRMNPLWK